MVLLSWMDPHSSYMSLMFFNEIRKMFNGKTPQVDVSCAGKHGGYK